jgi:hypothetical protein
MAFVGLEVTKSTSFTVSAESLLFLIPSLAEPIENKKNTNFSNFSLLLH